VAKHNLETESHDYSFFVFGWGVHILNIGLSIGYPGLCYSFLLLKFCAIRLNVRIMTEAPAWPLGSNS
jgi:hypothetical protein